MHPHVIKMENKDETLRLIDLLNDTYESEQAWHGPSVVEALKDVSPKMSEARLSPNTHSIAEIVYHLTNWRIFAVKKLQGDEQFDIKTRDKDWKTFAVVDDFEWEALQMELSLTQEELVSELEKIENDDFLEDIVPGRDYTYYTLLHGIIHHDLYHTGQVSFIKKGLQLRDLGEDGLESHDLGNRGSDFDVY